MMLASVVVAWLCAPVMAATGAAEPVSGAWTVKTEQGRTWVLDAGGVPVTVGQGLAAVGEGRVLEERALKMADTRKRPAALVGWALALATPVVMGLGSLGSLLVGVVFWTYAAFGNLEPFTPYVDGVILAGPMFVLAGVLGLVVWTLAMALVTGAAAYHFGWPREADPVTVASLGSQVEWDAEEARRVVDKRNSGVR